MAAASPTGEQVVGGLPAGGGRALHQRDGEVAADQVAGQQHPRVGRGDRGSIRPRGRVDQRAIGLDQPLLGEHRRTRERRLGALGLGPQPASDVGAGIGRRTGATRIDGTGQLAQRVTVHLDHGAAVPLRPPGGARLEGVQPGDVVQEPVPAGAEERRHLRQPAAEPAAPDREGRRDAQPGDPVAPLGVAQTVGVAHHPLQGGGVEGQDDGIRPLLAPVVDDPDAVPVRCHGAHRHPAPDVDAQRGQVARQRGPQRGVVVVVRDVEQQPLGAAQEVGVEHRQQFAAGELPRVGEEAAGEHLQRQVAGLGGEPEPVEHLGGAHAVQFGVGAGKVDPEQVDRGADVHPGQVADPEGGAERDEAEDAPRRGAGDPGERVGRAVRQPQRIVGDRPQPLQRRVGTAQQRAQVVVLPEEGVEAAAHRPVAAERPRPDPATQLGPRLQQRHRHATLGQPGGRRQAGDPAAHHDHPGTLRARPARRRRIDPDGAPVASRPPRPHGSPRDSRRPVTSQTIRLAVISAKPKPKSSIGMSHGNRIPENCSGW